MTTRKINESTKKIVAYSQKWKCNICYDMLPSTYQIDHIIPHSILNDDSLHNLQALCPNCHAKKTQSEYARIIKYKKQRAIVNHPICWFCIQKVVPNMECNCDKTLRNIEFQIPTQSCLINSFDKLLYIEEDNKIIPDNYELLLKKSFDKSCFIKKDNILKLTIEPEKLTINNTDEIIILDETDYTIEFIANCIWNSTRTKKYSNFFTEIAIDIIYTNQPDNPNDPERLIEHIHSKLPNLLPERIFSDVNNIKYTYFTDIF